MRNITGSQITCFWTSTFKQCILSINEYNEWSFDSIWKVQMSDENKILIVKSMLKRYRKYKCCVFIDFEYICSDLYYIYFLSCTCIMLMCNLINTFHCWFYNVFYLYFILMSIFNLYMYIFKCFYDPTL